MVRFCYAWQSASRNLPPRFLSAHLCAADKFLGWQSCAASGCHGGGKGDDQVNIWRKLDVHGNTQGRFNDPKSLAYVKELASARPRVPRSAPCAITRWRSAEGESARIAEGTESRGLVRDMHGPAEKWLRSHTREDFTHAQRLALGMRELDTKLPTGKFMRGMPWHRP
jgi:hypothetical protein